MYTLDKGLIQEKRNKKPLVKQINYDFGRNHESLYRLDREWAIKTEKLKGRELVHYDRSIRDQKRKEFQKKIWLMISTQEALNVIYGLRKRPVSFKLSFNEFNGYRVEYNGKVFETYNYLFDDYIQKIFFN